MSMNDKLIILNNKIARWTKGPGLINTIRMKLLVRNFHKELISEIKKMKTITPTQIIDVCMMYDTIKCLLNLCNTKFVENDRFKFILFTKNYPIIATIKVKFTTTLTSEFTACIEKEKDDGRITCHWIADSDDETKNFSEVLKSINYPKEYFDTDMKYSKNNLINTSYFILSNAITVAAEIACDSIKDNYNIYFNIGGHKI